MIDFLFDSLKDDILNGFDSSLEQQEILYFYKKYLEKHFSDVNDDLSLKDKLLKYEINNWRSLPKEMKQRLLIVDVNFEKITQISKLSFDYALAKSKGEDVDLTPEMANKFIDDMNTYYNGVRDFNKLVAQQIMGECFFDLRFASGLDTKTSLRIGRTR